MPEPHRTSGRSTPLRIRLRRSLVVLVTVLTLAASTAESPAAPQGDGSPGPAANATDSAEDLLIVDCLVPGQLRRLGRRKWFRTKPRPIKTSALECRIRGGEYVAHDRASLATALKVWLKSAEAGEAEAQNYVGEIFEKGLGLESDPEAAATWFRKAAEQGLASAQINLGYLYEKGLGVERDPAEALRWYRRASGLDDAIVLEQPGQTADPAEVTALKEEVARLERESDDLRRQVQDLQARLEAAGRELDSGKDKEGRIEAQLEQLRSELESRRRESADRSEIAALESRLTARQQDLDHQRREVRRLEAEAGDLRSQLSQTSDLKVEIERQQQTTEDLQRQLDESRRLLAEAGRQLGQRRQQEAASRRQLDSTREELEAMRTELAATADQDAVIADLEQRLVEREQELETGSQEIRRLEQEAQSHRDKLTEIQRSMTPVADPPPPPPVPEEIDFGTYYALIIGNNAYWHLPRLETAIHDATTLDELLKSKYGFETRLLTNANRSQLISALAELRKELTEKDNLLVYYAGHGNLDKAIERGYWLPVDAELENPANWVSTIDITDQLNAMSARHILVVADSCYSGSLTRSSVPRLDTGMSQEAWVNYLKKMVEKRSRTALTSGGLQPVLDSGGGKHSVFAKALLDVLAGNSGVLEAQKVHRQVAERVAWAAQPVLEQVPEYAPLKYARHEAGEFIFVAEAAGSAPDRKARIRSSGRHRHATVVHLRVVDQEPLAGLVHQVAIDLPVALGPLGVAVEMDQVQQLKGLRIEGVQRQ